MCTCLMVESYTLKKNATKLTEHFGPNLLVLSDLGIASLLVSRSRKSNILRLVAKKDDDVELELDKVAAHIVRESKKLAWEKNTYQRRIGIDDSVRFRGGGPGVRPSPF